MPLINLTGIVLRTYDLGEKDRIIVILSKEQGKLRLVAKGSRRPGSRFAAVSEPLVSIQAAINTGKNLHILTQAVILSSHRQLRQELPRLAYGLYIAEIVDRFVFDDEPQAAIFELLTEALRRLEISADLEMMLAYFLVQLLGALGLMPVWDYCIACQSDEQAIIAFDVEEAGVLCVECAGSRAKPLPGRAARLLGYLSSCSWNEAEGLANRCPSLVSPLVAALDQFIFYQMEYQPKSYSFLNLMRQH